jgi:hypothetical protein
MPPTIVFFKFSLPKPDEMIIHLEGAVVKEAV